MDPVKADDRGKQPLEKTSAEAPEITTAAGLTSSASCVRTDNVVDLWLNAAASSQAKPETSSTALNLIPTVLAR